MLFVIFCMVVEIVQISNQTSVNGLTWDVTVCLQRSFYTRKVGCYD